MALIPVLVNNGKKGSVHLCSMVILCVSSVESPYDPRSDHLIRAFQNRFQNTNLTKENLGCIPSKFDEPNWDCSEACYIAVNRAMKYHCLLCERNMGDTGDFIVFSKGPDINQWMHISCLSNQIGILAPALSIYCSRELDIPNREPSLPPFQNVNSRMLVNCLSMASELTKITELLSQFQQSIQHPEQPAGDIKLMLSDIPRAHQLSQNIEEELLSVRKLTQAY